MPGNSKATSPVENKLRVTPKRIIVFDSVCITCNRAARFILRHDKHALFYFTAKDSALAKKLKSDFGLDQNITEKTILLFDGSHVYTKSRGVLEIILELGFPWSLAYLFIIVPFFIRDMIYNAIRDNKQLFFKHTHTCQNMTENFESRFL